MEVVTTEGEVKKIEVPPDEYYPVIALPVFKPPAFVSKERYASSIEIVGYATVTPKRSLEEFARKHNAKEVATYSLRWPDAWAKNARKDRLCHRR
jgi:hypothetical protein